MKTQKSIITIALLFLFASFSFSQEAIQKEVDQQVWKVFTDSWTNYDHETFNSIHTDDVLRVSSRGLTIGQDYKDQNARQFKMGLQAKREKSIQFWFESRVYSGDRGYEIGYYKVQVKRPDQEDAVFYARFHIMLKKVNGQWKIAQDWDTSSVNGVPVTEADWNKGTALEF